MPKHSFVKLGGSRSRSPWRHLLLRRAQLVPRSRLAVCIVAFATSCCVLIATMAIITEPVQLVLSSPEPKYATIGSPQHRSVLGLTEPEVQIIAVPVDTHGYAYHETDNVETVAMFVAITDENLVSIVKSESWSILVNCQDKAFRYQIYLVIYNFCPSIGNQRSLAPSCSSNASLSSIELHAARGLRRACQPTSDPDQSLMTSSVVDVFIARVQLPVFRSGEDYLISSAPMIADLVTEAYIDNVTWYDVIFVEHSPFPADNSRQSFLWSSLAVGQGQSDHLRYVGAKAQRYEFANDFKLPAFRMAEVVFHRTHVEIFGQCWPSNLNTSSDVVDYVQFIYSHGSIDSRLKCSPLEDAIVDARQLLKRYINAVTNAANHCLRCYLLEPQHFPLSDTDLNNSPTKSSTGRTVQLPRRVISTVLYGDKSRYTIGAIRNAQLLPVVFPGWRLRIYVQRANSDTTPSSPPAVPQLVLDRLIDLGAELVFVDADDPTSIAFHVAPMLWRFLVIDDWNVDVFLSRDVDSRLAERDASVVEQWIGRTGHRWLESKQGDIAMLPAVFHCIRDHPSHSQYSVNGGMWGAIRRDLASVLGLDSALGPTPSAATDRNRSTIGQMLSRYGSQYMDDMHFIHEEVWSRLTIEESNLDDDVIRTSGNHRRRRLLCHDSVSCDLWPYAEPFPVRRRASEHVGQVFNARSVPREGDVNLLVAIARNRKCEPEPEALSTERQIYGAYFSCDDEPVASV